MTYLYPQNASSPGLILNQTPIKTSTYTILPTDYYIPVNTSGGTFSVYLPSSVPPVGWTCIITDVAGDCATNLLEVNPNGKSINFNTSPVNLSMDFGSLIIFSSVDFVNSTLQYFMVSNATPFGALQTAPPPSSNASMTLGTAYQNTTGYDAMASFYLNITVNTTGTIMCGVGNTNTPTQQTILSGLTAIGYFPVTVYLPVDYYVKISTSGITATLVGQQLTPV